MLGGDAPSGDTGVDDGTHTRKTPYEPPPSYDGKDPYSTWPTKRKEIELWAEDCELPREKRGTRQFWRLTGDAKAICSVLD